MTDLQTLFCAVDDLNILDLNELQAFIAQRQKLTWWVVSPENLAKIAEIMQPVQEDAAQYSEVEINAIIDEALAEVRISTILSHKPINYDKQ